MQLKEKGNKNKDLVDSMLVCVYIYNVYFKGIHK